MGFLTAQWVCKLPSRNSSQQERLLLVPAHQSSQPRAGHGVSDTNHAPVHPVPRKQRQVRDGRPLKPAVLLEHVCGCVGHSTVWLLLQQAFTIWLAHHTLHRRCFCFSKWRNATNSRKHLALGYPQKWHRGLATPFSEDFSPPQPCLHPGIMGSQRRKGTP